MMDRRQERLTARPCSHRPQAAASSGGRRRTAPPGYSTTGSHRKALPSAPAHPASVVASVEQRRRPGRVPEQASLRRRLDQSSPAAIPIDQRRRHQARLAPPRKRRGGLVQREPSDAADAGRQSSSADAKSRSTAQARPRLWLPSLNDAGRLLPASSSSHSLLPDTPSCCLYEAIWNELPASRRNKHAEFEEFGGSKTWGRESGFITSNLLFLQND